MRSCAQHGRRHLTCEDSQQPFHSNSSCCMCSCRSWGLHTATAAASQPKFSSKRWMWVLYMTNRALHHMSTEVCSAQPLVSLASAAPAGTGASGATPGSLSGRTRSGSPGGMCCAPAPARNLRLHEMRRQAHLLSCCGAREVTVQTGLISCSFLVSAIGPGRVLSSALPRCDIKQGLQQLLLLFCAGTLLWHEFGILKEGQAP